MRVSLALVLLIVACAPAVAAPKQIMLINRSGQDIASVSAADKNNSAALISVEISGGVASAESKFITVDMPGATCIADLTFTFASNTTQIQQDLDLCNLDGLVVE